MSLRFGSVGLFLSLVAIAYAANRAADEGAKTTRGPASIAAIHKEEKLGLLMTAPSIRHTEKIRGALSVKLDLIGTAPQVGETFILRGTIASRRLLDTAGFTWALPKGVELINGQIDGTLTNVSSDQPAIVEVTLKKTSAENQQVHLLASSTQGGTSFGDTAQYNTDLKFEASSGSAQSKATVGGIEMVPAGNKSGDVKVFH